MVKAKKQSSRGRKQDRARVAGGQNKMARSGGLTEFGRRVHCAPRQEQITTSAHAGNGLDVSAYRCVGVAARSRQNCCVHRSPLRPVATQHELPPTRGARVCFRKKWPFLVVARGLLRRMLLAYRTTPKRWEHSFTRSVLEAPINLRRRKQCRNSWPRLS